MKYQKYLAYHGSDDDFDTFEECSFFTNIKDMTSCFGQITYTCELKFINPFIVDADGQSWGGIFLEEESYWDELLNYCIINSGGNPEDENDEEVQYFNEYGITIDFLGSWAKEQGYDGVIAHNIYDDDTKYTSTQYIAINPKCIEILEKKQNLEQIEENIER